MRSPPTETDSDVRAAVDTNPANEPRLGAVITCVIVAPVLSVATIVIWSIVADYPLEARFILEQSIWFIVLAPLWLVLASLLLLFRRGIGASLRGERHAPGTVGRELHGSTIGILGLAARYGWVALPEQFAVFDHDIVIEVTKAHGIDQIIELDALCLIQVVGEVDVVGHGFSLSVSPLRRARIGSPAGLMRLTG